MEYACVNMEYNKSKKKLILHHLVDSIINGLATQLMAANSKIINEISSLLIIKTNPDIVESVIQELMYSLLNNNQNRHIRISAKEYGNILLLHVKDFNNENPGTSEILPFSVIDKAKQICGYIGVTRHYDNTTVVAFSFPNLPIAA